MGRSPQIGEEHEDMMLMSSAHPKVTLLKEEFNNQIDKMF